MRLSLLSRGLIGFCLFLILYSLFFKSRLTDFSSRSSISLHIPPYFQDACQFLERPVTGIEGQLADSRYRIRGLSVTFRHGVRSSLTEFSQDFGCSPYREEDRKAFSQYRKLLKSEDFEYFLRLDPKYKNEYSIHTENSHCLPGQLTAEGALQLISLGQFMRSRYGATHIFSEESLLNVTVTTSLFNRTLQSGVAFSSGFFYPLRSHLPQLYIKATPFVSLCSHPNCVCNKTWTYHVDSFDKTAPKDLVQGSHLLADMFDSFMESRPLVKILDISLTRYVCRRKPLPCRGNSCVTYDFLQKAWNYTSYERSAWNNDPRDRNMHIQNVIGGYGVLFHTYQQIQHMRTFPHTNMIKIHSGHDITVAPLLNAMGIPCLDFPRFVARVVFEIFEEKADTNKLFLRIIHNGEDVTGLASFCKSLVHGLCPVENFEHFVTKEVSQILGGKTWSDVDEMEDSLKSFYSSSDEEDAVQVEQIEPCSSKEKQGWLEMASDKIKKAGNMISLKSGKSRVELKKKWWGTWNSLKYSDKWQSDQSNDYDQGAIWLLGRFYAAEGEISVEKNSFLAFAKDYYSKIWITYRTGFPPFVGTEVTTDCGWGCMIRSAQMMTAQAICKGRLTRNWRFRGRKPSIVKRFNEEQTPEVAEDVHSFDDEHFSIIKLFEDTPESPLGIHRLISLVEKDHQKKAVGRWYSASEAISLLKRALSSTASPLTSDLAVLLCVDGHLKMGEAERLSRNWTKKLLVVVTIRMGTTEINKVYYQHMRVLFSVDSCLGMLGGRPDHSLYFIGAYNKEIVYLDPHVAHEYVPLTKEALERKKHPLSSYHCKNLSKMPFSEMDPSCAVGFFVQSYEELDKTVKTLNLHQVIDVDLGEGEGEKRTRDPLFAVVYGDEKNSFDHLTEATQEERDIAREHGFELL